MSIAAGVSLKVQERALELRSQRRAARLGGADGGGIFDKRNVVCD